MRFESVENASARELYTLIVYGAQEAYTTTYDGLFDRFVKQLKADQESPEGFLGNVGYDKFRTFIKLATQYNKLGKFLDMADPDLSQHLLRRFVEGIDKEKDMLPRLLRLQTRLLQQMTREI